MGNAPMQDSSSVENTVSGKGKSSNNLAWYTMSNNNLYFEPTDGSPGWYHYGNPKGKGKGKNYSIDTDTTVTLPAQELKLHQMYQA